MPTPGKGEQNKWKIVSQKQFLTWQEKEDSTEILSKVVDELKEAVYPDLLAEPMK